MMKKDDLLKAIRQAAAATPNKGMDDGIEARLSPGEYVIDSATVSLIGDGDSNAGASVIKKALEAIRKAKGLKDGKQPKKLVKGKGGPVTHVPFGKGGPVPHVPFKRGGKVPKSMEGLMRVLGIMP